VLQVTVEQLVVVEASCYLVFSQPDFDLRPS